MMAKDQFIEWLREKILQNPQEPPVDAWQEISDSLDLEESWNKIGEELEINTMWERIDSRLGRYDRVRDFEKICNGISAAAALLMLLFLLQPGLFTQKDYRAPDASIARVQTESSQREASSSPTYKETQGRGSGFSVKKSTNGTENKKGDLVNITGGGNAPPYRSRVFSGLGVKDVGTSNTIKGEPGLMAGKGIPVKAFSIIVQQKGNDSILIPEKLPVKVKEQGEPVRGELYPLAYVGAGTNLKWSWLLNNKTLHALEKSSLLSADPNFQNDYYLLYGYRLKPRLFLQADAYLKDVKGQEYREYRQGSFGKVEDRLVYQSLGVTVSRLRRQVSYGALPTYSRILGGLYGGRLRAAKEISESEEVSRTVEYKRHHFGLVAGYEYDTFLSERLIFTYGVRSRTDLMNIYTGIENLSPSFRKTRAFSLDFSVSFKYVLKK